MKPHVLQIRLTDEQYELMKKKADEAGEAVSETARRMLFEEPTVVDATPITDKIGKVAPEPANFWGRPAYQEHSRSCQCGVCAFAREAGLK